MQSKHEFKKAADCESHSARVLQLMSVPRIPSAAFPAPWHALGADPSDPHSCSAMERGWSRQHTASMNQVQNGAMNIKLL